MGTSKHIELERKFDAGLVSELAFHLWCDKHHPIRSAKTGYPDHYYRRGTSVVRHRLSGGAGELTVKQRLDIDDPTKRVEIDLKFDPGTDVDDVRAFVETTGWEQELVLVKHFSDVYWFKHNGAEIALSLYEVEDEASKITRRMMEVEVEKGSAVDDSTARQLLDIWCSVLTDDFHLEDPLRDSLYEIFTGKRYEVVQDRSL